MCRLVSAVFLGVSFLLFSGLAHAKPPARHAIKPAPKVVISGSVLLGSSERFSKVAEVDRSAVFAQIPAFQELREEELSRSNPRYHFLIVKANRVFRSVLTRVAKENGVDLVVTKGGVRASGVEVSDLTRMLAKAVR